jgi:hypothetical protein
MRRTTCLLVLLALLVFSAGLPAQSPDGSGYAGVRDPRALAKKNARLRRLLETRVSFPLPGDEDYLDEKTTLDELLDLLGDRHDVNFLVNEVAFKEAARGKEFDVLRKKVFARGFPKLVNVSLKSVLQAALNRVSLPSEDWATFIVRDGSVEITTSQRQRARIWGDNYNGPCLPAVDTHPQRRPLSKVLAELADDAAFTIVQDPRAARQLKTPVTANFCDAPLDTAVEILADLAGLCAVLKDKALYVTTPENALRLAQQDGATPAQPQSPSLPETSLSPERRPLSEILEDLAVETEFNIIQDPRVARQLKTPLTAALRGTPLDTAALILADMAGLRTVLKDNVLYVTTPENAQRLKQQQQQNRAPSPRPMARVKE